MTQTVEAIYQNGTFRPVKPGEIPLRDGQSVRLTIESPSEARNILELAGNVYEGLSEEERDEVESIALDRTTFFGSRD